MAWRAYYSPSLNNIVLLAPWDGMPDGVKTEGSDYVIVTVTAMGYAGSFRDNVACWLNKYDIVPATTNKPKYLEEILLHAKHRRDYTAQQRKHESCRPGACKCRLDPDYYGQEDFPTHRYLNGY